MNTLAYSPTEFSNFENVSTVSAHDVWSTPEIDGHEGVADVCQMAPPEVNKPKFLVNCGAFDRYLNDAPSGVITLPAYERNTDNEVIVHVGEVFCRVADCEHGKKPFQKTVGLREHLKKAHSQDGFAPVTLKAGNLDKATKDAAKAFFNGLYSRGASQASPVVTAPAKRPLPLKRGGEVNKSEIIRILGLNARKDVPCAACKAADLPKRCIYNKAICDHLAVFDIPEESQDEELDEA